MLAFGHSSPRRSSANDMSPIRTDTRLGQCISWSRTYVPRAAEAVPDVVDPVTRSRMMSGIRDKNTQPELRVRRRFHAAGLRYRLHARDLPGRPDIVFRSIKTVVFVHGCF